MSRLGRVRAAVVAGWHSFLRRRTAVFFTFLFPTLIVLIFGALVQTNPGGGGLFAEDPGWYVAGYVGVVVLFTPLSRVGSEVARTRDGNRFEKLATTPLTRVEWLVAQVLVNVVVIGLAALLVVGLLLVLTAARIPIRPGTLLVVPFVVLGVALFCGVGAILGSVADSQDGAVAASNTIALPLLFLSETFVPVSMLPDWIPTGLSPLSYFARGVRAVTYVPAEGTVLATHTGHDPVTNLGIVAVLATISLAVGARALPVTE